AATDTAAAAAAVVGSEDTWATTVSLLLSRPSVQPGSAPEDSPKRSVNDDALPSPQRPASPWATTVSLLLGRPSVQPGSAPKDSPKRSVNDDALPSPQRPASPPERLFSPSGVALNFGNGQSGAAEGAGGGQAASTATAAVSTRKAGDAAQQVSPLQEATGDARRRLGEKPIKQIEGAKRPTERSTGRQHPSASEWAHANSSLIVAPPMEMDGHISNADFAHLHHPIQAPARTCQNPMGFPPNTAYSVPAVQGGPPPLPAGLMLGGGVLPISGTSWPDAGRAPVLFTPPGPVSEYDYAPQGANPNLNHIHYGPPQHPHLQQQQLHDHLQQQHLQQQHLQQQHQQQQLHHHHHPPHHNQWQQSQIGFNFSNEVTAPTPEFWMPGAAYVNPANVKMPYSATAAAAAVAAAAAAAGPTTMKARTAAAGYTYHDASDSIDASDAATPAAPLSLANSNHVSADGDNASESPLMFSVFPDAAAAEAAVSATAGIWLVGDNSEDRAQYTAGEESGAPSTSTDSRASSLVNGGGDGPGDGGARAAAAGATAVVAGADGELRRDNAYNDIGLVVTRTKELEKILRDLFGASGNGLNELLSSLRNERRIDKRTQQRIRSIATMRNKLVHSVDANTLTVSNTFGHQARRTFKVIVDDLEVTLREAAAKVVEEPFEQATRPTDAYTLGNHPAFRGIGGAGGVGVGRDEDYDEAKGVEEAEAAAAAAGNNKRGAIVVKDNARFPHNLITVKARKQGRRGPSNASPAPNVMDEAAFPDISFATGAASKQKPPINGEGKVE
ncbi:unnamed protein product, partial [Laminaria digitata]